MDGSYEFTQADLSSIHGMGGILASTGKFEGTLGEIAVEGWRRFRQFRLDISDHSLPLQTEFQASGGWDDRRYALDEVRARIGRSDVTASGSVTRSGTGRGTRSIACGDGDGRIEDMMALAMKGEPTLMRGALATKVHIVVPPGPVSVSRKMRLGGTFAIQERI